MGLHSIGPTVALEATGLNLNAYVIVGCVGGVVFNLHNEIVKTC